MNAQIWDLGSRYGNGHYGMTNGNHAQDFIIMQLLNVFTVMSNGRGKYSNQLQPCNVSTSKCPLFMPEYVKNHN